ncbi:hypothetical protein ACPW96_19400 [Micromonospora sp. DT81.3]|uniref:hypothetical protein n=1 Tax=Micromonospora sp. DT81.3 TaxID=3416523 RepID=UPI003CF6E5C3
MRAHPSRAWSIIFAGLAGAWALFLLPLQLLAWYDAPEWATALDRSAFYRGVHEFVAGLGLRDDYLVFGSAISVSMVLLWWSTGPVMAWLGWSGRVFSAMLLLLAPLAFLSYLNRADSAPLRVLWGSEALGLMVLGVAGILTAVVTRAPRVKSWQRILLAATLPIELAFTLLFGYWPHGTVVGLALQACLLAAFAPRHETSTDGDQARFQSRNPDPSGAR